MLSIIAGIVGIARKEMPIRQAVTYMIALTVAGVMLMVQRIVPMGHNWYDFTELLNILGYIVGWWALGSIIGGHIAKRRSTGEL